MRSLVSSPLLTAHFPTPMASTTLSSRPVPSILVVRGACLSRGSPLFCTPDCFLRLAHPAAGGPSPCPRAAPLFPGLTLIPLSGPDPFHQHIFPGAVTGSHFSERGHSDVYQAESWRFPLPPPCAGQEPSSCWVEGPGEGLGWYNKGAMAVTIH